MCEFERNFIRWCSISSVNFLLYVCNFWKEKKHKDSFCFLEFHQTEKEERNGCKTLHNTNSWMRFFACLHNQKFAPFISKKNIYWKLIDWANEPFQLFSSNLFNDNYTTFGNFCPIVFFLLLFAGEIGETSSCCFHYYFRRLSMESNDGSIGHQVSDQPDSDVVMEIDAENLS